MKIRYFLVLLILFVFGCQQQQTKFVCADKSIVSSESLCPEVPQTQQMLSEKSKNYEQFTIELDFMGATGNEENGFGDGWIDSQDCIKAKNGNFDECKIDSVQLLFGSEPNHFKSANSGYSGGTIFGNGVVFRVKCACAT